METLSVPVGGLTIADLPETGAFRSELVDGSLFVTPLGDVRHQNAVRHLAGVIARLAPDDLLVFPGINVVSDDRNLSIPDIVVADATAVRRGGLGLHPTDVRWVIEVLSPSTRRLDRTLKSETYGSWGVAYWMVDPAERRVDRLGPTPPWAQALADDEVFPPA
jgi:Uma2 family endonuclease